MERDRARNVLGVIIAANVFLFVGRDEFSLRFSAYTHAYTVHGGTIASVVWSMFHHVDSSHLLVNMLCLWLYGKEVFVETSSRTWQSPPVIMSVYFLSGIFGSTGTALLSRLYEAQWNGRIRRTRKAVACSHWICQSVGADYFVRPFADMYTYASYGNEAGALWQYKLARRIGSSGAVFGVLGARVYTSFASAHHRPLSRMDAAFVFVQCVEEFVATPFSLGRLAGRSDGVDHAAHVSGLLGGVLIACAVQRYIRWKSRWRGGGRRLGRL